MDLGTSYHNLFPEKKIPQARRNWAGGAGGGGATPLPPPQIFAKVDLLKIDND